MTSADFTGLIFIVTFVSILLFILVNLALSWVTWWEYHPLCLRVILFLCLLSNEPGEFVFNLLGEQVAIFFDMGIEYFSRRVFLLVRQTLQSPYLHTSST